MFTTQYAMELLGETRAPIMNNDSFSSLEIVKALQGLDVSVDSFSDICTEKIFYDLMGKQLEESIFSVTQNIDKVSKSITKLVNDLGEYGKDSTFDEYQLL